MTTLLLTGATGLVGSRLLPRLAEAGFECRALVRATSTSRLGRPACARTSATQGHCGDAVEGVDAVVHLAALFRTATRTPSGGRISTAPAT